MKKRILQIIPTLDRAGAEKQLTLLALGLPREEFDVHVGVLTRTGPLATELEQGGIPHTLIGKRWKIDPQAYWRLRALVARLQPDLIHTWLFAGNAYGRAAGIACGVKCLVAGERCVDPWKGTGQLMIDRYLARRTAAIVANSSAVKEFYAEHGLPVEKFEVIPNGVPLPPPPSTSRAEMLAEFGLPESAHVIGMVGRLWPQKRVKDAIWAADLLKVVRDDAHLLIFGDGPHRARLERFRDQCEIGDKVHFLGHREDVSRWMPHFEQLWSTSAYEGQSNAILEAMSWGVPVVATSIPGTRDLVIDQQTGCLVETRDRAASSPTVNKAVAAGFARCATRLLNDRELAQRLGEAGRQRVRREFSVEKMIQAHVDLYRRLVETEGKGGSV